MTSSRCTLAGQSNLLGHGINEELELSFQEHTVLDASNGSQDIRVMKSSAESENSSGSKANEESSKQGDTSLGPTIIDSTPGPLINGGCSGYFLNPVCFSSK